MGNNWNSAPPLTNPNEQPSMFSDFGWFKKLLTSICEYTRYSYLSTSNHVLLAIITVLLVFIVCREVCRCRSSRGRPSITVSQINQQSLDRATDGRLQDPTSQRDSNPAHSTTQTNLNLTNVLKPTQSIGDLPSFIKNLSVSLANNLLPQSAIQVISTSDSKPESFRPEQADVDNWCKRFISYIKSNSITDKVGTLIASVDKVSAKHLTNLAGDRADDETF